MSELIRDKRAQEIAILERKKELAEGLPFLYGWKHYKWSRAFVESVNRECFLVAANQIGKSSAAIRKCISWATSPELWPSLWNIEAVGTPRQMWYLYPTREVSSIEFHTKWSLFLPRGEFKNHPQYGWHAEMDRRNIVAIHFNTGVSVYFKTYAQKPQDLQTGTCFAVFCFAGDTCIITRNGLRFIANVQAGEEVLTHLGWKPVKKRFVRMGETMERTFSHGETINATPNHPFMVGSKQVPFSSLTDAHLCHIAPGWKLIKRLFYLRRNSFFGYARVLIKGLRTTSGKRGVLPSMLLYGRRITANVYRKVAASTTRILTRLIIGSKTFSWLHVRSIQEYTSYKSGKKRKPTPTCAPTVEKSFWQKIQGRMKNVFAPALVAVERGFRSMYARNAVANSPLEKIKSSASVQKPVLTKQLVYNLEVEDAHTYYANGILVHNCDEELPEVLLPELQARLNASDGYFALIFTATLSQEHWRKCMEEQGNPLETHKGAFKQNISLFDCVTFEDGTPSHWTEEKIQRAIAKCPNKTEVQRRIYGRFVSSEDVKYSAFDHERNSAEAHPLPKSWLLYAGVDVGSGGEKGHPAAIVFVAVSPDYKQGRVFQAWRGDGVDTTPSDILVKYREMREGYTLLGQVYDWNSKDFFNVASRLGESFVPAEKNHEIGEGVLNTLFRHGMLKIQRGDSELEKLVAELTTLRNATPKTKAKDDLCDALRYTVMQIPWDFAAVEENLDLEALFRKAITKKKVKILTEAEEIDQNREEMRRGWLKKPEGTGTVDELDEWQRMYDVG